MRNLRYFLEDAINHRSRLHQLDLFGSFLQAKLKNGVFLKLDSRNAEFFQNIQFTLEEP